MTDTLNRQFKISLPLVRSYIDGGVLYLEGAASDSSNDRGNPRGRMSPSAIFGFVDCVRDGVPTAVVNDFSGNMPVMPPANSIDSESPYHVTVDNEHSEDWQDQIGWAVEARAITGEEVPQEWLDMGVEPPVFWVKLGFDLNLSHARDLGYKVGAIAGADGNFIAKPAKLGLSIAGTVLDAHNETYDDGTSIRVYDLVWLQKIAVTKQPANKNTWLSKIAKSVLQESLGEQVMRTEDEIEEPAEGTDSTEEPEATEAATEEVVTGADEVETPEAEPVAEEVTDAQPGDEAAEEAEAAIEDVATEVAEDALLGTDAPAEQTSEPEADEAEAEADADEAASLEGEDEAEAEEAKEGEADVEDVEAPVELTAPVTSEIVETVARAQVLAVETVLRARMDELDATNATLRNELANVKVLLSQVPAFVEAQNSAITTLNDALEQRDIELSKTKDELDDALVRLTALEAQPLGRRGMFARSSLSQNADNPVKNMTKEQRSEYMQKLRAEGKLEEAWALALEVL